MGDVDQEGEREVETVFARDSPWVPSVVRNDGDLFLFLPGGADANHDPREFLIPMTEAHLEVLRADQVRHLLLWSALLPQADRAGIRGDFPEMVGVDLLDRILLGTRGEVEKLFTEIRWDPRHLVARGADVGLLVGGEIFAALREVSADGNEDWSRARAHEDELRSSFVGVALTELDRAVMAYTGGLRRTVEPPVRDAEAVDPKLRHRVLELVEAAGRALDDDPFPRVSRALRLPGRRDRSSSETYRRVRDRARHLQPDLAWRVAEAVSELLCSEARARAETPTLPLEVDRADAHPADLDGWHLTTDISTDLTLSRVLTEVVEPFLLTAPRTTWRCRARIRGEWVAFGKVVTRGPEELGAFLLVADMPVLTFTGPGADRLEVFCNVEG